MGEGRPKSLLEQLLSSNIAFVDEEFSKKDQEHVQEFKIDKTSSFDFYGEDLADLGKETSTFLSELGNNSQESIEAIQQVIERATQGMIDEFSGQAAWVSVRSSLPTHEYDIPRWHPDGGYFDSENKVYKKVMTIKGPSTRFGRIKDKEKFNALLRENPDDLQTRRKLDEMIEEMESCKSGESTVYLVGDEDAAVHSEPVTNEPRLFVSVLVGSKAQIEQWKNSS